MEFNGKYPVFVFYDNFPIRTDFEMPKNIPHQVKWARFHLENKVRLIGFVIPDNFHFQRKSINGGNKSSVTGRGGD